MMARMFHLAAVAVALLLGACLVTPSHGLVSGRPGAARMNGWALMAKAKKGAKKGGKKGAAMGGFGGGAASEEVAQSAGAGMNVQRAADKAFYDLKEAEGLSQGRVYVRERNGEWKAVARMRVVGGESEMKQTVQFYKRLVIEHSQLLHVEFKSKTDLETGFEKVDAFPEEDEEEAAPSNVVAVARTEVTAGLKNGMSLDEILSGPMFKRMMSQKFGKNPTQAIKVAAVAKTIEENEE